MRMWYSVVAVLEVILVSIIILVAHGFHILEPNALMITLSRFCSNLPEAVLLTLICLQTMTEQNESPICSLAKEKQATALVSPVNSGINGIPNSTSKYREVLSRAWWSSIAESSRQFIHCLLVWDTFVMYLSFGELLLQDQMVVCHTTPFSAMVDRAMKKTSAWAVTVYSMCGCKNFPTKHIANTRHLLYVWSSIYHVWLWCTLEFFFSFLWPVLYIRSSIYYVRLWCTLVFFFLF